MGIYDWYYSRIRDSTERELISKGGKIDNQEVFNKFVRKDAIESMVIWGIIVVGIIIVIIKTFSLA